MNRNFVLVTALVAAMSSAAGVAQTAGSPAASAPATARPAPPAPHATPAKIALIEYEQVAAATNEGQRDLQTLQKKYEPKKVQLQTLAQEVESLKKQLQSTSTTLSDADRASRQRTIDTKEKQLQRDGEDAQNSYNGELQETVGAVAKKLGPVVIKYVQENGYTMLLDNTGQQGGGLSVLWTQPGTSDISQAIVDAYNASSGVAAPAPSAPTPSTRPRSATPRPPASK
jgi:outer membrane protein